MDYEERRKVEQQIINLKSDLESRESDIGDWKIAKAQEYAAQMLLGSARMVLETGRHPGELKDAVCSPGGSTIQGVRALERGGFRSAVMEAVIAAYEKTTQLGK